MSILRKRNVKKLLLIMKMVVISIRQRSFGRIIIRIK